MICEKCGAEINGMLEAAQHPCFIKSAEYKSLADNEMRTAFIELGMPDMGFEFLGFAKPTKMERVIFERPEPKEEPEPPPSEEDIAFDAVFSKMTEEERWNLLLLGANGMQQGNMIIYGAAAMERLIAFKDNMRKKYS